MKCEEILLKPRQKELLTAMIEAGQNEFRKNFPRAYKRWADSESHLWARDSEEQLTNIGYLCREAMQEFATELVDKYKPSNIE